MKRQMVGLRVFVAFLLSVALSQAAFAVPSWWVVSRMDLRMARVSMSVFTFAGPLMSRERCHLLLEDTMDAFREKQRRLRESNPDLTVTLAINRCQTGVMVSSKGSTSWWTVGDLEGQLDQASIRYFTYSGPYATVAACRQSLAGFKQGFSEGTAWRTSKLGPGYTARLFSAKCAQLSVKF